MRSVAAARPGLVRRCLAPAPVRNRRLRRWGGAGLRVGQRDPGAPLDVRDEGRSELRVVRQPGRIRARRDQRGPAGPLLLGQRQADVVRRASPGSRRARRCTGCGRGRPRPARSPRARDACRSCARRPARAADPPAPCRRTPRSGAATPRARRPTRTASESSCNACNHTQQGISDRRDLGLRSRSRRPRCPRARSAGSGRPSSRARGRGRSRSTSSIRSNRPRIARGRSPVATRSSQRFHNAGMSSKPGSPASGFGSITSHGCRFAAITLS